MCGCRVRLLTAIYRSRIRNVERDETIHYIIEHRLPVSGPAWKELGNHCFGPHSKKKAERTANHQLFLNPSDN